MTLQEASKEITKFDKFKNEKFLDGSKIEYIVIAPRDIFINEFINDLFIYFNYPESENSKKLKALDLNYDILFIINNNDKTISTRWAKDIFPNEF